MPDAGHCRRSSGRRRSLPAGTAVSRRRRPGSNCGKCGPRGGFAWDISGNGRTVLRAGGGLTYETVNWQSFVAFNNAFGPGSVPTGWTINGGQTSGGTIVTGNVTTKNFLNPVQVPWDQGPVYPKHVDAFTEPEPEARPARQMLVRCSYFTLEYVQSRETFE